MQKVLTAEQMKEVDRLTTANFGIPSLLLMENAANAVAKEIEKKLGSVKDKWIVILCGKGNNGGDGAALGRILWTKGAKVSVLLHGRVFETLGDARINFEKLQTCVDIEFREMTAIAEMLDWWKVIRTKRKFDVIVDAVLGTGLSRAVEGDTDTFLTLARNYWTDVHPLLRVAVDLPSGLPSNSGMPIGPVFESDLTVTFTALKPAQVLAPNYAKNGEVVVADIGSPPELLDSELFVTEVADVESWLYESRFRDDSYKNKRGHAVLIAGSREFAGAAVLAANAAMRSGVGLVTLIAPETTLPLICERLLPEIIVRGVAETEAGTIAHDAYDQIDDLLAKADAVAIGCGLGQHDSTRKFVRKIVENRIRTMIVDADALNLLSPYLLSANDLPPLILTPHEGEFLRILGTQDKSQITDRVSAVRKFAGENKVTLVLKGERTLIGTPNGDVVVNPTGNAGLGKAGNGDTLTGFIAGLSAQAERIGIDTNRTIVAAVYIAGRAADICASRFGKRVMTASDVRELFARTFEELASAEN